MHKHDIYSDAKDTMVSEHAKPKKEIREVRARKGKTGGHIVEHHHTAPEHYPVEEHVTPDMAALQAHMAGALGDGTGDDAAAAAPAQPAQPTAPVQAA